MQDGFFCQLFSLHSRYAVGTPEKQGFLHPKKELYPDSLLRIIKLAAVKTLADILSLIIRACKLCLYLKDFQHSPVHNPGYDRDLR